MATLTVSRAEEIAADWRRSTDQPAGLENPAGPIFSAGDYAESEITMTGGAWAAGYTCGTVCTGSDIYKCC